MRKGESQLLYLADIAFVLFRRRASLRMGHHPGDQIAMCDEVVYGCNLGHGERSLPALYVG